jgi:hypothetical protein
MGPAVGPGDAVTGRAPSPIGLVAALVVGVLLLSAVLRSIRAVRAPVPASQAARRMAVDHDRQLIVVPDPAPQRSR